MKFIKMINFIKYIAKLSRFRFWVYLWGPYILGYTFKLEGFQNYLSVSFFLHLFYFLIPANILLYGINDFFDVDTDSNNLKKTELELKYSQRDFKPYSLAIAFSVIYTLVLLIIVEHTLIERIYLAAFIVLAYLYSGKPFRFKALPVIDFISNILYIFPGLIGYYETSQMLIDIKAIIILGLWTGAMQLFSAIPDILPDKQAGLKTTAVILREKNSLVLCFIMWLIFAVLALAMGSFGMFSILFFLYPLIVSVLIIRPQIRISKIYGLFPYINFIIGGFIFLLLFISRVIK